MNRGGRREGEESRVQSWAGIRSWFANKIRVLNGQTKWTGRPVADLLTGFSSPRQPEDLLVFVQLSLHAPLPPHIALLIRSRIEINLDILTGAGFLSFVPFNRSNSFLLFNREIIRFLSMSFIKSVEKQECTSIIVRKINQ